MELKQLSYFQKICRCGSLSRAAEELFVTQQALSRSLSQLEAELGTDLIRRNTRRMELTDAGSRLLTQVEHILEEVEAIPSLVAGEIAPPQKTWRIGFGRGILGSNGGLISIAALKQAEEIFTEVHFQIEEGNSDTMADALVEEELDAAVMVTSVDYEKFRNLRLVAPEIRLVVPKGHALQGKTTGTLADIRSDTIFLPYGADENRAMVRSRFFEDNVPVPPEKQFRLPNCSLFTLLDYVYAGEGVTLLSETYEPYMDRSKCTVLHLEPEMTLPIRFCYRRDHPDAERLDAFGGQLKSICEAFLQELREA